MNVKRETAVFEQLRTLVHDARNPLNRLSMQAELAIALAERENSSPQLQKALRIIVNACQECSETLTQIAELPNTSPSNIPVAKRTDYPSR